MTKRETLNMIRLLGSNHSIKLFTTSILVLILTSILCLPLVPPAQAAEPNLQAKSLTILKDVIGINTDSYNASKSTLRDAAFLGSAQKETDQQLTSTQSSLRVTCSYVKDTLKLVYLSDVEGNVSLKQPVNNTLDMAKGVLERYKDYAQDSIYDKFASMLTDVKASEKSTKFDGNVKLDVSGSEQSRVSYMWTYVDSNGVPAEKKNVILVFEKGAFKGFFNNWPLYTIAETESRFSAEQAEELAIEASKNFSYPVTFSNGTEKMVSGFSIAPESLGNAKLIYINSVEEAFARDGDPYRMYLAWYVPLGFDRFYPGDVSGMTVILWADTGEVCGMDRVIVDSGLSNSFSPQTIEDTTAVGESPQYQPADLSTQAVGVSAVTGLAFVTLASSKLIVTGHKKRNCKLLGMLLCVSVAFSMIFVSSPSVSALGKSRVYGIDTITHDYKNLDADLAEGAASRDLCNFIGNASLYAGYDTTNLFGSGTINTTVISNAGSDEQSFAGTMVFHAGHFTQFNQAYKDNVGGRIDASDIYAQTGLGKHFFVFLWVCVQAENPAWGMPAAWLHRDGSPGHPLLGSDGFTNPDSLGQCYISFYGFSPMLSTYVNQSGGYYYNFADVGSSGPCSWFAMKFYNYALYEDYSVRDSLDIASGEFFGCDYSNTVLHTGYNSWWPGGDWYSDPDMPYLSRAGYFPRDFRNETGLADRPDNRMRVFGDSTIKLTQKYVTFAAKDNYDNTLSTPTFTVDGEEVYMSSCYMLNRVHSVSVPDKEGYAFSHFSYNGQTYYGRPANIPITTNGVLTAHYNLLVYHNLTISSGSGGTTDPSPGIYSCVETSDFNVKAIPNSGKVLNYWRLDGTQNLGNSYLLTLMMDAEHTLEAFFTNRPSYSFAVDVDYYSEPSNPSLVEHPYKLTGYQPDGYYSTINSYEPYQAYGTISAVLNEQSTGYISVYGYGSGALLVEISNNGISWTSMGNRYFSATPQWVDCGFSESPFSYIRLTGAGSSMDTVYVDSIRVEPPIYYTLWLSSSGGGYTTPSGTPGYVAGTYAYVQAHEHAGWYFYQWLIDGYPAGYDPEIYVYMDDDHTLEAVFYEYEYSLTINSGEGGTTSPGAGVYWYTHGTQVYVEAFEDYGYDFSHWVLNGQNVGSNPVVFTLTFDSELTPVFESIPPTQYFLTVYSGAGGYTNPGSGTYAYDSGDYATVYAYPDGGYEFDYWLVDGLPAGSSNPISIYMDGSYSVEPVFLELPPPNYYLTVLAYDTYFSHGYPLPYVNVWIDGDWRGYAGDSFLVSAGTHTIEVDGWHYHTIFDAWLAFEYWTDAGYGHLSYDNPMSIMVEADTEVIAGYPAQWLRGQTAPQGLTPELYLQLREAGLIEQVLNNPQQLNDFLTNPNKYITDNT